MNKFPERLKELRLENNLTRQQLADKLKINARTISYWELGQRECNLDQLYALALVLKTTTDYLIGLEN